MKTRIRANGIKGYSGLRQSCGAHCQGEMFNFYDSFVRFCGLDEKWGHSTLKLSPSRPILRSSRLNQLMPIPDNPGTYQAGIPKSTENENGGTSWCRHTRDCLRTASGGIRQCQAGNRAGAPVWPFSCRHRRHSHSYRRSRNSARHRPPCAVCAPRSTPRQPAARARTSDA